MTMTQAITDLFHCFLHDPTHLSIFILVILLFLHYKNNMCMAAAVFIRSNYMIYLFLA